MRAQEANQRLETQHDPLAHGQELEQNGGETAAAT